MIVITGQTATGKTAIALKYAKKYDGELVNFDSRQVYKYLDIVTGKDLPTGKIHFYDIVAPNEYFSSHDFAVRANRVIAEIKKRGKTPILVGGTYLYIKHLLYGFDISTPPNFRLREKLSSKTVKELQKELKKIDQTVFEKMNYSDQNNPRRLVRKIEIALFPSPREKASQTIIPKVFLGLRFKNNADLRQAIENRVEKRLKEGAIDEVRSILKRGYGENDPGIKTIGYRELIGYIKGRVSKDKAVSDWINHEVQYARRQYTFMKKDQNISWREI